MKRLLGLFAVLSASALAAPPPSAPATYVYQELQPGFRMDVILKSAKSCAEGKFPSIVSDEWSKEISATNERKGKKIKLKDRTILIRSECEGKRAQMKLELEVRNDSSQFEHVHLTLLDGLTIDSAEHVEMKKHP